MSAADLATIREALQAPMIASPRVLNALAALARIEQNTLTPEEASTALTGLAYWNWADLGGKDAPLVAKLERIAGDTGEAT